MTTTTQTVAEWKNSSAKNSWKMQTFKGMNLLIFNINGEESVQTMDANFHREFSSVAAAEKFITALRDLQKKS